MNKLALISIIIFISGCSLNEGLDRKVSREKNSSIKEAKGTFSPGTCREIHNKRMEILQQMAARNKIYQDARNSESGWDDVVKESSNTVAISGLEDFGLATAFVGMVGSTQASNRKRDLDRLNESSQLRLKRLNDFFKLKGCG